VDIDGDGDYDCFIGAYPTFPAVEYFENTGDNTHPHFEQKTGADNPLNFLHGFYALYFNLVDIDGDGDYDLYMNDIYYNKLFENVGTRNNPEFVLIRSNGSFLNRFYGNEIFFDWNHDGLFDLITPGYTRDNFFIISTKISAQ